MSNEPEIIRQAVGAGRWFPGKGEELGQVVRGFIAQAEVEAPGGRMLSAIAPHAGYVFSGRVAGYAFRALKDSADEFGAPETVVVLGFSHSASYRGVALMDGDALVTPIGRSELDQEALDILTNGRDRVFTSYAPHDGEHSAENEIPFVQAVLPEAKLVVGLYGDHDGVTMSQLLEGLAELAKKKSIVVIASTDLLHDPDYDLVTKTDRETLTAIAALDSKSIAEGWQPRRQICCGIMTVLTAMAFASQHGAEQGAILYYRNNGDDDPSSHGKWVVGYGAVGFYASQDS